MYGLGVGPGDPELITLKAYRLLDECSVVAYPSPEDGQSFARSIVEPYLRPNHVEIPIIIPMRSERFPAQDVYDLASQEIAAYLDAGRDVAVLCEGDPFFYGSFMYLFERLSSRYATQIIPGVSSLMASAAALGRPIAARNDVLSVIPAPLGDEVIARRLEESEAVAFIKVGRHFERICNLIEKAGLTGSAGYLERVSLGNEKIMALGDVSGTEAPYFSMILIYKGAEDWIGKLPLLESGAGTSPDQTEFSQPETRI